MFFIKYVLNERRSKKRGVIMAIEGLSSTYSIPAVKKERETEMNQKKKQKKGSKKDKKKEADEQKIKEGRIDIRI